MPIDPNAPVPQVGPHNASFYDGTTPEKTFDYGTPEGRVVLAKDGRKSDTLGAALGMVSRQIGVYYAGRAVLADIKAQGLESRANIAPMPLQGTLGSVALPTLAPAIGASVMLLDFMDAPQATLGGVTILDALLGVSGPPANRA